MADMAGPLEVPLATLHVENSTGDGTIVAAAVRAGAIQLGLSDEQADHLSLAAKAVAHAVYIRGFDDLAEAALDLSLTSVGHQVVVRIDDLGLPFSNAARDAVDLDVIETALREGWIDTITHESRGRAGNRTVLIRHLDPGPDLRHDAIAEDPTVPVPGDVEPVALDADLATRMAVPDDAEAICRLTWRTYGYSYQHDEYYQPGRLASMIESGLQTSFVVAGPDGEIVGHSALLLDHPDDVIVEGGRAMVDPRFRGHHLMGGAKDLRDRWLIEHGILALEGAAVTAHTRSQTDRPIASMQLGFLPAIEFRGIDGSDVGTREAVLGGIWPITTIPHQHVTVPERDAAMIAEIYRRNDLPRTTKGSDHVPAERSTSHLGLEVRGDLGHAVIDCARIGADLQIELGTRVASLARGGVDVVYVDIPLDRPAVSWAVEACNAEGFFFSGVLPLAHRGTDVVRYQRLGATVVDPGSIQLRHPFSEELLAYVLAQRAELVGP